MILNINTSKYVTILRELMPGHGTIHLQLMISFSPTVEYKT